MSRPDTLDAKLKELALKVVKDTLDGMTDDDHKARVETLKVAGNFAVARKRATKNDAPDDDENTMSGIAKRINNAEGRVQ